MIESNLQSIKTRILHATQSINTSVDSVCLVAVSKLKSVQDIQQAYTAGHRHFAELVDKTPQLPKDIHWHFIGQLQSNKVKLLPLCLYAVESCDSIKKADLLEKHFMNRNPALKVFVQVNTSNEESKGGVDEIKCSELVRHILEKCPSLNMTGLMTIGAANRNLDHVNPDFKCLLDLKMRLDKEYGIELGLSMGMSDDFEEAIKMGASNVRIGSKIFGGR